MSTKSFVGRSRELTQIKDRLQRSTGCLVWITGAGGIGKTSILQKIAQEYSDDDRFVVEYFDLAEQPATVINQAVHLVNSLGPENFPKFGQKITELETGPREFTTIDLEEEAVDLCVQEVAVYLQKQKKKLLRITDTFEIALRYNLYKDDWAKGINDKLRGIPDTVFIIAGRDRLNDGRDVLNVGNFFWGREHLAYSSGWI
jgi:GTPase SAR1 family protein